MTPAPDGSAAVRPRVEGDREQEILEATLDVLAEVGYDRLTMDAVAAAARASKATLYRRWSTKPALVIDALLAEKQPPVVPDTGSLRGDLLHAYCGHGGVTDERQMAVMASVITAIMRDADFAEAFRTEFIGPKVAVTREIYARARERGELRDDLDLDLIGPALAGIVMHRHFLLGQPPDARTIERILDQVILPAVRPTHRQDPS